MAKPAQVAPILIVDKKLYDELYELNYIQGNIQRFRLVRFNGIGSLPDLVDVAKMYCSRNNFRFIRIEPAVVNIDWETGLTLE